MARIARALDASDAAQALFDLNVAIGARTSLKELGMPEDGIEQAVALATKNPYYNPAPVTADGVRRLLPECVGGPKTMKDGTMKIDRVLTTHVGSLPRPKDVVGLLFAQDKGEPVDEQQFDRLMREAITNAVRQQQEAGLDVINDGEMSKISYATYMRHRLNGFELGSAPRATPQDLDDYPDYRDKIAAEGATPKYVRPICRGPITREDASAGSR